MKPFMLQARQGRFVVWIMDSRYDELSEAIVAAEKLHVDWGRTVRVIDQNEKVHFRLPVITRRKLANSRTP